jgi:hypothetical protein
MHVDGADHREATTSSIVAELPQAGPPVAHVLLGSPCQAAYQPVEVSAAHLGPVDAAIAT